MNKKCLLLFFNNEEDEIMKAINEYDTLNAECVFIPINFFLRVIRKIHIKSNLPGISIWLGKWKHDISQYDQVICIASMYSYRILKWVKKANKKIRVINYFWDSIAISNYKIKRIKSIENWSFDQNDSTRYGLKYNPQFYVRQKLESNKKCLYDVVYVGSDRNGILKNRRKILSELYELLSGMDCKCKFCLLTKSNDINPEIKISQPIKSDQYNKIVSQGKVLLDIVEEGNEWMTLRPLLALSNKKKVITNNIYIKKEKYYLKDDIFILGEDDKDSIKQFIDSPFTVIPSDNMEYYECAEWIKRFDIGD